MCGSSRALTLRTVLFRPLADSLPRTVRSRALLPARFLHQTSSSSTIPKYFDVGKSIRHSLPTVLVLCYLLISSAAWSQDEYEPRQLAAIPSTGRIDYDVIREGNSVGTHSVTFRHQGASLKVATQTDIAVELLGITLYHFRYEAEEEWANGRLARLISFTDNDGQALTVNLVRAGSRISGTCNDAAVNMPADILPISIWHPDFVRQTVIFDQYKCTLRGVEASDYGIEPVLVGGQKMTARHYVMTGKVLQDIWYGADGQIVQVRLPAKDGSEIAFVIRTPPEARLITKGISTSPVGAHRTTR